MQNNKKKKKLSLASMLLDILMEPTEEHLNAAYSVISPTLTSWGVAIVVFTQAAAHSL